MADDTKNGDGLAIDPIDLLETNRRLNRKNQELESQIAKNQMYQRGWSAGWSSGRDDTEERAKKHYDRKLAEYKHATREEMRKLRSSNTEVRRERSELS